MAFLVQDKLVQHTMGPAAGPVEAWRSQSLCLVRASLSSTHYRSICWTEKVMEDSISLLVEDKLIQQTVGPAAGPIRASTNLMALLVEDKVVQHTIGPAAGPIKAWRDLIALLTENKACPAHHWSSCWTDEGLEE